MSSLTILPLHTAYRFNIVPDRIALASAHGTPVSGTSTGRKCDYADHAARVPRLLSASSAMSRVRRAYEYYFFHAAPSLSDALDLDFWRGTVLRILHRDALVWYSRSLHRLQEQIQRGIVDYAVALVSCVLSICIEILQGNVKAALVLYHQAARLLATGVSGSNIDAVLAPILRRIGTIAVIINGELPLIDSPPSPRTNTFTSLSDARSALYALVAEWKVFDCDCAVARQLLELHPDTSFLQTRQHSLEGRLLAWHEGLQTVILILTRTGLSATETCYDAYEADFTEIIGHAPTALSATATATGGNQPPFVLDMGPVMGLLITSLKCRSPGLRRQVLRLLRQAPPLHGMYFSRSASDFLAAVVAVEESGPDCSEEELSLASLLARPGRFPSDSERVFSLQLLPWRTPHGEMRTALRYSQREIVQDATRIRNDTVVLPARSPYKPLSIL
ncbi:hypothetical protein BDW62DRAFT_214797 [Aspergillus aurantiobrunneus]